MDVDRAFGRGADRFDAWFRGDAGRELEPRRGWSKIEITALDGRSVPRDLLGRFGAAPYSGSTIHTNTRRTAYFREDIGTSVPITITCHLNIGALSGAAANER